MEIDWDNKILELENKSIDVVWNGMTLTNEVKSAMECTVPYLNNAQVVVVPAADADNYTTAESVAELSFAVESGSAGEQAAADINESLGEEKVHFLPSDFKKKEGYKRSIELSEKFDLYRQDFCGCSFSKAEREADKMKKSIE